MAITVEQLETHIIAQTSGYLSQCKMVVVANGSNPDLAAPITDAMRALGYGLTNPIVPSDLDLQGVPDNRLDLLLSVVRLYTLRACLGRWAQVDETVSLGSQKLNQLADQLQAAIESLTKDLLNRYGFGRRRRPPKVGRIQSGNVWPNLPPPPCSAAPWPDGYTAPPGPEPAAGITQLGFNP